jgi:phosphoglucomutase
MRFSFLAVASFMALLSSFPKSASTDAFVPKHHHRAFHQPRTTSSLSATASIAEVPTAPIQGMKPGTSGLRKKVEVWQGKEGDKYYVENFIQSLIDTATEKNGGKVPET